MSLHWDIFIILSVSCSVVYSGSCHVCNSIADPGCGLTLETSYETQCVPGHLGCKKTVKMYNDYYGNIVTRSCYNNTYANHTLVQGSPYYSLMAGTLRASVPETCVMAGKVDTWSKNFCLSWRL